MQYFGADGLGSVRQIYNSAGIVQMNERYDPFGNVMSANGTATSVYGFTGEQTDATGLVYLRARYYEPTQGRFTMRDTWEGDYQRPLSLNRWNYTKANPTNWTDPSGHCEEGDEGCWSVYTQIIQWCPECVNMRISRTRHTVPLSEGTTPELQGILKNVLRAKSSYPDRSDIGFLNDLVISSALDTIKEESLRFGVPWQVSAGIFESERELDTGKDNLLRETCYAIMESAAGPDGVDIVCLNSGLSRTGNNPGSGIANIHADTARGIAAYFARYHALDQCIDARLGINENESNLDIVITLGSPSASLRVMTAYVRELADYRYGVNEQPLQKSHANLAEWMISDAVAVWHGYRYGVPGVSPEGQGLGFARLRDFQNRGASLDQLIDHIIIGKGDAKTSARESVPIFEKYFRLR